MKEKILVLDFGGQYCQLIARRVREARVYAEIRAYNKITVAEIVAAGYMGVILTGGPNSVYDPASPKFDAALLNAGIPVLGICYGAQLMAYLAGGEVRPATGGSEYGKTAVTVCGSPLFEGVPEQSVCWMSHTDYISSVPDGFSVTATTDKCPCAAMCDEKRGLYALQFHPEVAHTQYGSAMLKNFLFSVCGCAGDWQMEDFIESAVARYKTELARNCPECLPDQYFAVLTDLMSVGVKGDARSYGRTIVLRAVTTDDFMTASFTRLPFEALEAASGRITNEVAGVARVVYDITSKPPATVEWE